MVEQSVFRIVISEFKAFSTTYWFCDHEPIAQVPVGTQFPQQHNEYDCRTCYAVLL